MIDTTRRGFILGAGAATGALLVGPGVLADTGQSVVSNVSSAPVIPGKSESLKGYLHTIGPYGNLYPGQAVNKKAAILTSLDLKNGSVRQTPLSMSGAHSAIGVGDGRILCLAKYGRTNLLLTHDHKLIEAFRAPKGYVYSGHGLVYNKRNLFIMTLGAEHTATAADQGKMEVYDLTTLQRISIVDSGGLGPHEITEIPGTDEILVAHYGDIYGKNAPFFFNVVDAKLTVLDAKTFKPKRHYPQPEFNALISHTQVDKHGWAYFIMLQSIPYKKPADLSPNQDPLTVALTDMQQHTGHICDFPLPYETMEDKNLAVPLPFVRLNTQTGERQILNTGDKNHLVSQSVAYNHKTGIALSSYFWSNTLILHIPGKEPEVISGLKMGLDGVRGLTEVPGTSCVAASSGHYGISILDLATRKVVAYYPAMTYYSSHLHYDGANV